MSKYGSIHKDDDTSFLEEAGEFVQYGITGALASGGISIANTAISLGNAFGMDVDEIDTSEVLQDAGMYETADYYDDHKDALDAVGFVATSFVPGMAGVKALRAVQKGAKLTSSNRLVTGFKAAAVPEASIKPVIRAIRAGRMEDAVGLEKYKLIAKGFQQQALEAAAYEGAVLLTMNQNPTINAGDYGYFESMAENAAGAAFGVVLGGAIGGAVEGLVNVGKINTLVSKHELRASKLRKGGQEGNINALKGDKALSSFRAYSRVRDTTPEDVSFNGKNLGKLRQLREAKTSQEEAFKVELLDLAGGNAAMSDALFKQLVTKTDDQARDFLSGMSKARAYYDKDALFDVPMSQVDHVLKGDFDAAMYKFYDSRKVAWHAGKNGKLTPENVAKAHANTNGVAFSGGIFNGTGMSKISDDLDWENIFTWRHETGHLNANKLAGLFKDSELGKRIKAQAEALSREARPANWGSVKSVEEIKELSRTNAVAAKGDNMWRAYMHNPKELLADSYAMLSNPKTTELMRKKAPDLYKFMVGNKAIAHEYGPSKSIVDIATGALTSKGFTPTIADLGDIVKPVMKGKKLVALDYGKKGADRVVLATPYTVESLMQVGKKGQPNLTQVGGMFSASKIRTDIVEGMEIPWDDLPRLTAAYAQKINVKVVRDGVELDPTLGIRTHLINTKAALHKALKKSQLKLPEAKRYTTSQAARLLDTSESFLTKVSDDMGTNAAARGQLDETVDFPIWSAREGIDPMKPSYIVMEADKRSMLNGVQLKAVSADKNRTEAIRRANETPIASYMDEVYGAMPRSAYQAGENFADHIKSTDHTSSALGATRSDTGNGMSIPQFIGKLTNKQNRKFHTQVDDTFESDISAITNDSKALAELSVLDAKLRQDWYKFAPSTVDELVMKVGDDLVPDNLEVLDASGYLKDVLSGGNNIWTRNISDLVDNILTNKSLSADSLERKVEQLGAMIANNGIHTIQSDSVAKLWRGMVDYNSTKIVQHKKSLAAARGSSSSLDGDVLYPGAVNTSRFPHFAMVVTNPEKANGIMSDKASGMIFAHDATALASKIRRAESVYGDKVKVLRKGEIEAYKKEHGDFDSALLMRENSMDSSLQRNGLGWDVTPEPDVGIMQDYMSNFKRQHTALTRGFVELKYSEEIAGLNHYGKNLELNEASTTGYFKGKKRNPYHDTVSLMLDKSNRDRSEMWDAVNTATDKAFSSMYYSVKGVFNNAAHTGDWKEMNAALTNYGMDAIYSDMNKLVLQNVHAPKPVLEGLTAKLNGILATSMLRLDTAQAIVNTISTPIMLVPEFKAMVKLAKADRVKVLKDGTRVTIAGSGHDVGNAGSMMMQAMKDFHNRPELVAKYRKMGVLDSTLEEVKKGLDLAAVNPSTPISDTMKRLNKAVDIMATPTDKSEQLVKFVAARVADMVGETLNTAPHIRESAINSFVTRVHGNYLASQRPTLFQGWAGQAIGLFQTYQFNLIQGTMKHISSGNGKAMASMVGLQGGIFGAQSLPGFQYLNQHVGERSGDNNDFYSTVNSLAGDEFGNFLLYGAASSATVPILGNGIDLYSRGDLTPRTPILLPTSPAEIPIVSFTNKLVSNITQAADKIGNGAPLGQTMQEALAHNGFNRPLAGLMQVLGTEQRTTNKGALLRTYQTWDTWNVLTKALGAKPLDEAVAVSSFYRATSYKSYRAEKLEQLGQAYKSAVAAGENTSELYKEMGMKYAEQGGSIEKFASWTARQNSRVTNSQINELRKVNNTPEGKYLQEVMGAPMEDMYNPPVQEGG